jgi:hypothetical protein
MSSTILTNLPTTSIPLTTIFTPSSPCLSDYYQYETTNSYGYYVLGPPTPSVCFPSGWAPSSQYFSPGLCPSGYIIACSTTANIGTITETRATCCPSSWACQVSGNDMLYGWFSTIECTLAETSVIMITNVNGSTTTIYPTSSVGVNAYGVSVRWQSTDFLTSTTISSYSTPTSILISTHTTTIISNPQPLSSGAQAGIGIGVAIFVLLIIASLGFFVFWRRRSRAHLAQAVPGSNEPQGVEEVGFQVGKPELSATSVLPRRPIGDGDGGAEGRVMHELQGQ